MANAVSRAYNGGLGRSLQQGPGAELLVKGQGRSPLKLKVFRLSKYQQSSLLVLQESTGQRSRSAHWWMTLMTLMALVDGPDGTDDLGG